MNINPAIKYGLTFLTGLGIGGFVVHSIYVKKIEEINSSLDNAYNMLEEASERRIQENLNKTYSDCIKQYTGGSDPDFDAHFAERECPEEDEYEEIDEYVEDPHAGERRDRPYFITDVEFNHGHYDMECLYYYIPNQILTIAEENSVDEGVVSDPENFLGEDVWKHLSAISYKVDDSNLYVRNDYVGTDYEIYILEEEYEEPTMSLDEAMLYYDGEEEVDE